MAAPEADEPEAAETGTDAGDTDSADSDSDRRRGGGNPMAAFGNRRDRGGDEGEFIEEIDAAMDGDKLVVLFVYCDSDERKYRRATAATKQFEENVFGNYDVAEEMQDTVNIRFDGTEMTRELRKAYKLSSAIPQIVLIDVNGKVLYKGTASTNPQTLAKMIKAAKERCAELVADRNEG